MLGENTKHYKYFDSEQETENVDLTSYPVK